MAPGPRRSSYSVKRAHRARIADCCRASLAGSTSRQGGTVRAVTDPGDSADNFDYCVATLLRLLFRLTRVARRDVVSVAAVVRESDETIQSVKMMDPDGRFSAHFWALKQAQERLEMTAVIAFEPELCCVDSSEAIFWAICSCLTASLSTLRCRLAISFPIVSSWRNSSAGSPLLVCSD